MHASPPQADWHLIIVSPTSKGGGPPAHYCHTSKTGRAGSRGYRSIFSLNCGNPRPDRAVAAVPSLAHVLDSGFAQHWESEQSCPCSMMVSARRVAHVFRRGGSDECMRAMLAPDHRVPHLQVRGPPAPCCARMGHARSLCGLCALCGELSGITVEHLAGILEVSRRVWGITAAEDPRT